MRACTAAVWWTHPAAPSLRKVEHSSSDILIICIYLASALLTDLHYEDLNLYGAASVTLSRMDQNMCSDAVCEEEVAPNISKICNGTKQK